MGAIEHNSKEALQKSDGKEPSVRILYLENDPLDFTLVQLHFEKELFDAVLRRVETREQFLENLAGFAPDCILLDYQLPLLNALDALQLLNEKKIDIAVVLYTGAVGEEQAFECLRLGADDYVTKQNPRRLVPAIKAAIEKKKAAKALRASEERFSTAFRFSPIPMAIYHPPDGHIVDVNYAFITALGYTRDEIIGHTTYELQLFADLADRNSIQQIIRERGLLENFEFGLRKKSGEIIIALNSVRLIEFGGEKHYLSLLLDITERRKAEKEIAERSRLLEALFTNYLTCIALLDRDFNFIRVNEAYARACAREVSEFPGHNHFEFYPSEAKTIFEDVVRTKKPVHISARPFVYPDHPEWGTTYWDWTLVPLLDRSGEVEFLVFSLLNVSERKLAELEREQFFKFFNISADLMVIADPNGCFKKTNPACLQTLGYTETDLLAKPFIDFVHPDDRQPTLDEMTRQIQLGFSLNFENRYICKNGAIRWLSWIANYDKEEGITYATARDITERKRAEEALRESEAKFRGIYEESPVGIELYDREGTLLDANRACLKIFGVSGASAVKGFKLFEDPNLSEELKVQLRRGESVRYEIPFDFERVHALKLYETTKRGTIYLDLLITPLCGVTKESAVGYLVHVRDITERKQAEELLHQTMNRLLETEETLKRTAAQQLHDQVGQNLTALNLNLSFVQNQIHQLQNVKLEKRLTDSMALVEDTVEQIRNIMTDLRPPGLDDFGLHSALEWSIARFTERTSLIVDYLGQELTKRLPLNLEYALFRMAQEALHNVMKHARASHVRMTMKENRDSVRLTIQDDGIGFDLKKCAEKKEGQGFGLTDIAERMKALGGTFEITSSPGKGTRIILEIKYKTS